MFALMLLSNGTNDGTTACSSATSAAARLIPSVPLRYRYDPKNHRLSLASGPPTSASGCFTDIVWLEPPGWLLPTQSIGV